MKRGGKGGASTKTGLEYEAKVDLAEALSCIEGYTVEKVSGRVGRIIKFESNEVARLYRKHEFYDFLAENNVAWENYISKKLLPDDALLVIIRETLFIIEVKYQQVAGSVDEKLQTCDFKRKQYTKLVHGLGLKVEYVYVLNSWFEHSTYKDTLAYIHSVGCHYKFGNIPISWLGLPCKQSQELKLV